MIKKDYFFRIVSYSKQTGKSELLGTGFPINKEGGILTCRHVADIVESSNFIVAVEDVDGNLLTKGKLDVRYPDVPGIDIAYIKGVLPINKPYLTLLEPQKLTLGEDVYSFGFFKSATDAGLMVSEGYFKGNVVNFVQATMNDPSAKLTTSYPIIEGLSGAPIMTYYNGPKVVGLAFGSVSSRIVASEVAEVYDDGKVFNETIHRITELGQGYHSASLATYLNMMKVKFYTDA